MLPWSRCSAKTSYRQTDTDRWGERNSTNSCSSGLLLANEWSSSNYARAGVAEYWEVDLQARAVDVFRSPSGESYLEVRRAKPAENIELLAFPGVTVSLSDFLD